LFKPMMLALAAGGALIAGLAAGAFDEADRRAALAARRTAVMAAQWTYRPRDLAELTSRAPAAVLARVARVRSGPPLAEDGEAVRTPTQRIELVVERRLRGTTPARLALFKTGSQTEWIEDDPPYTVGERYLLFIRPRRNDPTRAWIPVAPDGRLRIERGGLAPLAAGPVGRALARERVGTAERLIRRARRKGP
jgi:hypothetical protein